MDGIGGVLVCTLLLLLQCGTGAELNISSPNTSPSLQTGDTINLTISYSSTPIMIIWSINDSVVALWSEGITSIPPNYQNRITLQKQYMSINSSTMADSGEYRVRITAANADSGTLVFNVVVRDRVQEIQSNDTGIYKTGENITLTIRYEGDPLGIVWNYNGSPLAIKSLTYTYVFPSFNGRAILDENGSLLIYNTTKEDAGNYSVSVSTSSVPASRSFLVKFYDPVKTVTVNKSPQTVSERTSLVNLSCSSSSEDIEAVTWKKDGQLIINDITFNLLDGNKTLQIIGPNRTFSGNYNCTMSNAAYSNWGSLQLRVYDPVENVIVTQSPGIVSEGSASVNLTCSSSSGYHESVTWMKNGQPILDNLYNLLDGNLILQINHPNRTFSGNYSCTISNAVYLSSNFLQLRVYDPVENVAVTQSPHTVTEETAMVRLSCSVSSGYNESVTWTKDEELIINNNTYNLLDGNDTLQIIQPTRTFSGNYTCIISNAAFSKSGYLLLRVYDPIENVSVTQSPEIASEDTAAVHLSCNASSGYIESVTWMKDGQPIINDSTYSLLNGNETLQIIKPKKTFNGNYSCIMSNAAYKGFNSLLLRVYDPVGNVTVTQWPQMVSEETPMLSLSCSASSGYNESTTWKKDEEPIINNETYKLLDGNDTLQIIQPNRTFSGNYTCTISNAAYSNFGSLQVRVYDPIENVTVTQSPEIASEDTAAVNLSCNASSGYNESVTWMKDGKLITNDNNYTLSDGNLILQITKPNKTFSGIYTCNISNAAYKDSASHQLRVYDRVVNVKVTQSPKDVNVKTPLVKLSCSASSGYIEEVTWTKDGKSVTTGNKYSLLDGKRTLQITAPNKTFSGIYTCNMSNAAYWESGWLNLTVSHATLSATSTFGMIITSLLGGLLLAL